MTHPALTVHPATARAQRMQVSTLPTLKLREWVSGVDVLAAVNQARLARHPHSGVRAALAEHAPLLRTIQLDLAKDTNYWVRRNLARHPHLDHEAYEILRASGDSYILASLAGRAPLTAEDVTDLVGLSDHGVLSALVARPDLPVEVLRRIVMDARSEGGANSYGVLSSAARNADLPDDLLAVLLKGSAHTRFLLAYNQHVSLEVKLTLARDPDPVVRRTLASLTTLDPSILAFLINDTNAEVLTALVQRTDVTDDQLRRLAQGRVSAFGRALAHRATLPDDVLCEVFAVQGDTHLDRVVAKHSNLPLDLLEKAFANPDRHFGLAQNPALPVDLQLALAQADSDPMVLHALRLNPALVLDERFPVRVLRLTNSDLLAVPSGVDPHTWDRLVAEWDGPLSTLLTTARTLGPG